MEQDKQGCLQVKLISDPEELSEHSAVSDFFQKHHKAGKQCKLKLFLKITIDQAWIIQSCYLLQKQATIISTGPQDGLSLFLWASIKNQPGWQHCTVKTRAMRKSRVFWGGGGWGGAAQAHCWTNWFRMNANLKLIMQMLPCSKSINKIWKVLQICPDQTDSLCTHCNANNITW